MQLTGFRLLRFWSFLTGSQKGGFRCNGGTIIDLFPQIHRFLVRGAQNLHAEPARALNAEYCTTARRILRASSNQRIEFLLSIWIIKFLSTNLRPTHQIQRRNPTGKRNETPPSAGKNKPSSCRQPGRRTVTTFHYDRVERGEQEKGKQTAEQTNPTEHTRIGSRIDSNRLTPKSSSETAFEK